MTRFFQVDASDPGSASGFWLLRHDDENECKVLAAGNWEKKIVLWDPETGAKLRTLTKHIGGKWGLIGLAFAPNGKTLACADACFTDECGLVSLYDL